MTPDDIERLAEGDLTAGARHAPPSAERVVLVLEYALDSDADPDAVERVVHDYVRRLQGVPLFAPMNPPVVHAAIRDVEGLLENGPDGENADIEPETERVAKAFVPLKQDIAEDGTRVIREVRVVDASFDLHGMGTVEAIDGLGQPVCGSKFALTMRADDVERRGETACTFPAGHPPIVDPDGSTWGHGVMDGQGRWTDRLVGLEHDPQPVRVSDGEPVCGATFPDPPAGSGTLYCTYPPDHPRLIDSEGAEWDHGLAGTPLLWMRYLKAAPDVLGSTGVIFVCSACGTPTESEPCPEHQADPAPPSLAARSLAAMDSASAVSAHLKARRAVEDMAAAHREQLGEARAATEKCRQDRDRWRAEAEAARAQVGTLTAERDRYREALVRIARGTPLAAGQSGAATQANLRRDIAREALGGTP